MQRFSHRVETLEPGRVTRHALLTGNQVSSYRQVLDLLLRDGAFRQFLSGVLASGGVAWLHVRLEGAPKYYAYRPYARAT